MRDLRLLKLAGVPIALRSSGRHNAIRAGSFLPRTELSLREAAELMTLVHDLADREDGIPFLTHARAALLKLLRDMDLQDAGKLSESMLIVAERRNVAGQKMHFERFEDAIVDDLKLRVTFKSPEGLEQTTLVSPYGMAFVAGGWVVVGRSSAHRQVIAIELATVTKTTLTQDRFSRPPRFSLRTEVQRRCA